MNCTGRNLSGAIPHYNKNGTVGTLNANGRFFGTTSGHPKVVVAETKVGVSGNPCR